MRDGFVAGIAVISAAISALLLAQAPRERRLRSLRVNVSPPPWQAWPAAIVGHVIRIGPGARARRSSERARVLSAMRALVAELDAGQPPRTALERVGCDYSQGGAARASPWPRAVVAARTGGDVAAALDQDAELRPVLKQLAACWRVAEQSGSGLAASVARLAESARAAEEVRSDLEAELAGPRATARMLAALPLFGVAFGFLLGANPVAWLWGTGAGRMCLMGGLVLTAMGTWWIGRITRRVEAHL